MKTICVKCGWHTSIDSRRMEHRCYAPWPRAANKVTGKMEPVYTDCETQNNGACDHFKPKWYVRAWKYINKHFVYPSS
jgi:hypothetical protein